MKIAVLFAKSATNIFMKLMETIFTTHARFNLQRGDIKISLMKIAVLFAKSATNIFMKLMETIFTTHARFNLQRGDIKNISNTVCISPLKSPLRLNGVE